MCGRGNEIICKCIESLFEFIKGMSFLEIVNDPIHWNDRLANDSQMRWLGPSCGAIYMAVSAINNAFFDAWAWVVDQPFWKLICSMNSNELMKILNTRYLKINGNPFGDTRMDIRKKRIEFMEKYGHPLYSTSCGWINYTDKEIQDKCINTIENENIQSF